MTDFPTQLSIYVIHYASQQLIDKAIICRVSVMRPEVADQLAVLVCLLFVHSFFILKTGIDKNEKLTVIPF